MNVQNFVRYIFLSLRVQRSNLRQNHWIASSLTLLAMTFFLSFAPVATLAAKPDIEEFSLENGLHVIVIEDHRIPAVSHNLLFKFGAADDPSGKSGLAHYMEHMLFQGTKKHKPNEYNMLIAAKGGKTNAFTTADYTGYWVNIAKEHLPLVMELEADRMQNLQSSDAEFAKEKKVILEERRMRVDNNPAALFDEQIKAALYLNHHYGTPIIGWAREMQALDKPAVMDYYKKYYNPANAVLVLAGDITVNTARNLVDKYYADIKPRGHAVPERKQEPPQLASRRLSMSNALVKQPEWLRTFVTPSYGWKREENKDKFIPLMIADYLLGGGKTSRLYKILVEEKRLAQSVYTDFNPFRRGPGEFSIGVVPLDAAKLPEIEKIIESEISKFIKTPPSTAELERAKTQLLASNVYLQDGLQSLAQVMGHLAMIGLSLDYYFKWEETIEKVTAKQVSDSLKLLDDNYSVTGVLSGK